MGLYREFSAMESDAAVLFKVSFSDIIFQSSLLLWNQKKRNRRLI